MEIFPVMHSAEKLIQGLDEYFEIVYAKALDARDRFWVEARASGKTLFRGVAISRRGNSVDIYWLRFAYKSTSTARRRSHSKQGAKG